MSLVAYYSGSDSEDEEKEEVKEREDKASGKQVIGNVKQEKDDAIAIDDLIQDEDDWEISSEAAERSSDESLFSMLPDPASNDSSKELFTALPPPKQTGVVDEVTEEELPSANVTDSAQQPDDDIPIVMPKKFVELPKPLSKKKGGRVQISLPTFNKHESDSDEDDEGGKQMTARQTSKIRSALIGLLPKPKHSVVVCHNQNKPIAKQSNRILMPHTLTKNKPKPTAIISNQEISKPVKSTTSENTLVTEDVESESDEDDDHSSTSSFFSLGNTNKPVIQSSTTALKDETILDEHKDNSANLANVSLNSTEIKPTSKAFAPILPIWKRSLPSTKASSSSSSIPNKSFEPPPPGTLETPNLSNRPATMETKPDKKDNDFFKNLVNLGGAASNSKKPSTQVEPNQTVSHKSKNGTSTQIPYPAGLIQSAPSPIQVPTTTSTNDANSSSKYNVTGPYSGPTEAVTGPYTSVTGPYTSVTGPYGASSVTGPYGSNMDSVTGPYISSSNSNISAVTGPYGSSKSVTGSYANHSHISVPYGSTGDVAGPYGERTECSSSEHQHTSTESQGGQETYYYSGKDNGRTPQQSQDSIDGPILDQNALTRLAGGKRRHGEEMNIIEIRGDELVQTDTEKLLHLTQQDEYKAKKPTGEGPTHKEKRKHQITYLAHQAKEREFELQRQWGESRATKQQSMNKYGF